MGAEAEEYHSLGHTDRPGKKPSLHSRLQSGKMNININHFTYYVERKISITWYFGCVYCANIHSYVILYVFYLFHAITMFPMVWSQG